MRHLTIVPVSGRCRRDGRHTGTCRQVALHYLAWCRAAGPVIPASGIRGTARERKSLLPSAPGPCLPPARVFRGYPRRGVMR